MEWCFGMADSVIKANEEDYFGFCKVKLQFSSTIPNRCKEIHWILNFLKKGMKNKFTKDEYWVNLLLIIVDYSVVSIFCEDNC